jgi:heptaprenyl diphosphate synthase
MKTKKLAFIGISVALAMILSFVESQIPALIAVPGVKVGLPNLVIVFLLYKCGWREAALVNFVRVVLSSILLGNVQTLTFSLAGAAISLLGMILLMRTEKFSSVAVSVVGGVLHNLGQILAAVLWLGTMEIAYYLPVLLISGTVAGVLIGIVSGMLVKRLEKIKF